MAKEKTFLPPTAKSAGKTKTLASNPDDGGGKASSHPDNEWNLEASHIKTESNDPLLGALVAVSRFFGRPYTPESLKAGLPLQNNRLSPDLFTRAAARAGLSARVTQREYSKIPEMVLPVVLLLKNGDACVLVSRSKSGRKAVVIFPETGTGSMEITKTELMDRYTGYVIFIKPEFQYKHRAEPLVPHFTKSWFWGTLRHFWPTYSQVILAACLINLFALASPLFVMNVYDRVVPNQALETLWVLAIGICLIFSFDFLLKTLRAYFLNNAGKRADILLSSRIFEQVLNLKLHSRPTSSGEFANRLREFETLREFFSSATMVAIVDLPFIFLFLYVIYIIGGVVVLAPAVAIPIVILSGIIIQLPLRRMVAQNAEEKSHKHGIIMETVAALDTVKSLGAESRMQSDWERFVGKAAKSSLSTQNVSSIGINFATMIMQLVTVGVIILGIGQIIDGMLTVGGLIACTIIAGRAMAPLGQVAGILARLNQSLSALKGLNEIMALPVERPAGKRFLSRPDVKGSIELQDVSFAYPGAEVLALHKVSFKIAAGEHVAIVGPVGCGKTTISRLIGGLYEPTEGAVLLDGTDIRQIDPADVRHAIGSVMQDVILFQGSVRDNIAISVPHADDAMILKASQLAGAHDFISQHPQGYDLLVGERGQLLSGGQRQFIALARALLPNPPVLLLDEPTSMMDNHTEALFTSRLKHVIGDKTVVAISHRTELLSLTERVIVMAQGKVVADGPRAKILGTGQKPQPGTARSQPVVKTTTTPGKPTKPKPTKP